MRDDPEVTEHGGLRLRYCGSGRPDAPVLLLLHGLGATGAVWRGAQDLLHAQWPGRWVAPDLPGHGRSGRLPVYSFGHLAAAVAPAVAGAGRVAVLGHSLGGVVALALASGWFGVRVDAVCALGVKVRWTPDELAAAAARAGRPARRFDARAVAAERFLAVAGLTGLWEPDDPAVADALVCRDDGTWEVAFDPAAFGVGAPDLPGLLAAARARVVLAAGEHDPMCRPEALRELDPDAVVLPGLGHNAHVERPDALAPLLDLLG